MGSLPIGGKDGGAGGSWPLYRLSVMQRSEAVAYLAQAKRHTAEATRSAAYALGCDIQPDPSGRKRWQITTPAGAVLFARTLKTVAAYILSELETMARPHLPGEAPTPSPAPSHGTAAPKLPDLKGAADKVAALEHLAGGGALSSDVWCALGWPFEAFLAWAQRPDADARESALRARIRRDGVAACLARL